MVFGEGAEDNTRGRVRSPEKELPALRNRGGRFSHKSLILLFHVHLHRLVSKAEEVKANV
jgi:hypothetical protein